MTHPDLTALPDMALENDEPVFREPWEAQAFAMVIDLHQHGVFDWSEWADFLSKEVHSGLERPYYQHWLCALEKIVAAKKLTSVEDLHQRQKDWHAAAAATPHGAPIVLGAR